MIPRAASNSNTLLLLWMLLIAVIASSNGRHLLSLVAASSEERWCLERGFDPSNLACDTCALLEESSTLQTLQNEHNAKIMSTATTTAESGGDSSDGIVDIGAECRACCRVHKVNPLLRPGESLRGKYRFALLTYGEHDLEQYGEIKDFLERDLEDLIARKGESGLKAVPSSQKSIAENQNGMMMLMMMGGGLGFGGGPPKLMLFEKQRQGGWSEEDEMEAGEVIPLRGWKREDVNDMLMTLLPNA